MSPSTCWVAKYSKIEGWGQENSMKISIKLYRVPYPKSLSSSPPYILKQKMKAKESIGNISKH
jgi:hypothetical protein